MSLDIFQTLTDLHRAFHDRIALDLTALHDGGSPAAFATLVAAGFLYGVFHAAGPGHGKVIIGSYMLADDHALRRGLLITALSSLLQAVVAIALVLVLFYGLGLARETTEYAAAWFEAFSFALVALVGGFLFLRGLRGALGVWRGHRHRHHAGGCCDHAHGPDAAQISTAQGPLAIAAIIASVGLRPCSGALILLFFSCLLGEVWAGIAATLAMALGTALTTGAIATAAATSRRGILRAVGQSEARVAILSAAIKIIGGLVIALLGVMFCVSSLPGANAHTIAPYNHPLMRH